MKPILEEGNCRIILTECSLETPLCIINCYLPSGNSKQAVTDFDEDMNVLTEILSKYKSTHKVILLGDFNADHYHRCGPKERQLLQLLRENPLYDPGTSNTEATYVNPHLNHRSRIDHIFLGLGKLDVSDSNLILIKDDDGLNSSYHTPLSVTLKMSSKLTKKGHNTSKRTVFIRKEMDVVLFQETVEDLLSATNTDLLSSTDAVVIVQKVNAIRIATPQ